MRRYVPATSPVAAASQAVVADSTARGLFEFGGRSRTVPTARHQSWKRYLRAVHDRGRYNAHPEIRSREAGCEARSVDFYPAIAIVRALRPRHALHARCDKRKENSRASAAPARPSRAQSPIDWSRRLERQGATPGDYQTVDDSRRRWSRAGRFGKWSRTAVCCMSAATTGSTPVDQRHQLRQRPASAGSQIISGPMVVYERRDGNGKCTGKPDWTTWAVRRSATRERPERLAQRPQPLAVGLPLLHPIAVDGAAHLLRARGVHAPLGLVELQTCLLEGQTAVVE